MRRCGQNQETFSTDFRIQFDGLTKKGDSFTQTGSGQTKPYKKGNWMFVPSQLVGLGLPLGSTEAELEAKLEQDRQAQAAAEAKELAEVRK